MAKQEMLEKIFNLGKFLFPEDELSLYLEQIKKYRFNPTTFFSCITQEKESVQLESSFLTETMLFDFTLAKNKTEVSMIPLNKITSIQNNITDHSKMVITIYTNDFFLRYKTFNEKDTGNLNNYSISVINQFNTK